MPYQIKNGIIYSGNAVTLTQAQYDALPTIQKNNGTVYYIYDSNDIVDAEDVGVNGGNVEDLAGSVATFETSQATSSHAVGEYILYQANLYKVIAPIDSGETLTVGSNIESAKVGDELSELKNGLNYKDWFNWSSYLNSQEQETNALCTAMVTNNTVSVSIRTKSRVHAENDVIMTIPEGYRPLIDLHVIAKVGSDDVCVLLVRTNGSVYIWSAPTGTSSGRLIAQFTYVY